jgi:stage II sporulation protein D
MKKIIVFLFVFALLIISYKEKEIIFKEEILVVKKDESIKNTNKETNIKKESNKKNNNSPNIKTVSIVYKDNKKETLNLEDYVVGVVACEMPASFNIEALKAMAVAARTFALYKIEKNKNYKLSTTTKDQCYITVNQMKKNWGKSFQKNYNKILKSVKETSNERMTYNDKTIISFYFSISNGYTQDCDKVFSQKLSYLKSVDSHWDKEYSYKERVVKFTVEDFLKNLGINDKSVNSIKIVKDKTKRAKYVYINNNKYKGTKFRALLHLRSTDVKIENKNNYIYITTRGYGHGVGMSQYGANSMAKKGYKYDEILKYYYKGIKISV